MGIRKKSIRDTDEGSAVSGCTFLRGQSDPGKKKALNLMGMEVGPLRLPLTEMEEKMQKVLEEVMRTYGLLK